MKQHIWINQGFSSTRDIALQIKSLSPNTVLTVTHKDERPEITNLSDRGPVGEPRNTTPEEYLAFAVNLIDSARHDSMPVSGMIATRYRRTIARNIELFHNRGVKVFTGSKSGDLLDLCEDKALFTTALSDAGIPVPLTFEASTSTEIKAAMEDVKAAGLQPCIKPAIGVYGSGFWILDEHADDSELLYNREALSITPDTYLRLYEKSAPKRQIVMETLPGLEISVDAVCVDGRIVSHACRTKHNGHQFISTHGDAHDIAQEVAKLCQLDGLVNIQLKADVKGALKVLEVNTRAAGGFSYSQVAGINLGHDCFKALHGESITGVTLNAPIMVKTVNTTITI